MFKLNKKGSLQIAPLEKALNRAAKHPLQENRQVPHFYLLLYLRSLTGPVHFNLCALAVWVILWQVGILGVAGSLIYWIAYLSMPLFMAIDLHRTIEKNLADRQQ
jgi:hypothetical protein